MAVSNDFMHFVLDQMSTWGEVTARRMFGGAGLYREGKMFGLIADDVVYFKVDDSNRDRYLKMGSTAFRPYEASGKTTSMSYYELPSEVLECPDELARWAELSWNIQNRPISPASGRTSTKRK